MKRESKYCFLILALLMLLNAIGSNSFSKLKNKTINIERIYEMSEEQLDN